MFGKVQDVPQTKGLRSIRASPSGAAKLYAHWITANYREAYGLHTTSGILFNHESPLRGPEFVTRKITLGLAQIRHGRAEPIRLGNLDAERDWGFAGDFVKGMWLMLQQPEGDDYVLATGRTHSVREFVESAAAAAGFDLDWRGKAEKTEGVDRGTGQVLVKVDPEFYRPAEVDQLLGDPTKARDKLGWQPEVSFEQLVEMMVRADMARVAAKP